MSGAAAFILLWSLGAIGLGAFFAARPAALERLAARTGQRFGYTQRTRRLQVHLNRFGGVLMVVVGVVLAVLVMIGVILPK